MLDPLYVPCPCHRITQISERTSRFYTTQTIVEIDQSRQKGNLRFGQELNLFLFLMSCSRYGGLFDMFDILLHLYSVSILAYAMSYIFWRIQ